MATAATDLYALQFGGADLAASPGGTAMPVLGMPDVADVSVQLISAPCIVLGINLQCPNASGDTMTATIQRNGVTLNPALNAQTTNASPAVVGNVPVTNQGPPLYPRFNQGDTLGISYSTTTSGAYTVKDALCTVLLGSTEPMANVNV